MKKYILILSALLSFTVVVSQSKIQKKTDSISLLIEKTNGETRNEHIFQLGQLYGLHTNDTINFSKEIIKAEAESFKETAAFNFYMGLVNGYSENNAYEEAERALEISLTYLSTPANKGRFYRSKGLVLQEQSKFEKAQEAFGEAISYYETTNNKEALQDCYHNMAASIQQLGQYEEAIALQQKSLKLAEQLSDLSGKAKCLNNISVLYQKLDNLETSEKYILQAIEIDESLQDKKGAAGSYINLGIVNRKIALQDEDNVDKNRLKKARDSYKKALQIAEEINYVAVKAAGLANLANLENDYGNYNDAIKYGKESLAYSVEQNNIFGEMISKLNLGYSYRLNKEYSKAKLQLEDALAIAKKINFQAGIESCYNEISILYKETKQFEKSLSYYEDFINLKDSLASVEVKKNLNELEVKFETEKKEHDLAETRANLAESELEVKNRNIYILGIAGLALLLGLIGYTYYYRQKQKNIQLQKEGELKTAFAKIETQNKLQEQRLRISRDLHDNIGSQLTFVTSSIDNLKYRIKGQDDTVENKLQDISEFTTGTIYELRDTIWAMNKTEITFDDLQSRIANFIEKASSTSETVDFLLHISEAISKDSSFTSIVGMHIYRIIQEAVNNALKYANATKVSVSFNTKSNGYEIAITDNGKGFDLETVEYGNGIRNMKKRAEEIVSDLNIKSVSGEGTKIHFIV